MGFRREILPKASARRVENALRELLGVDSLSEALQLLRG